MLRWSLLLVFVLPLTTSSVKADIVLDWNAMLCHAVQEDGILNNPAKADPGWSTRAAAMMNGAIYDAFQAVERTHQPFSYTQMDLTASKEAAAVQAAYEILLDCYPLRSAMLEHARTVSMSNIADGAAKTAGIALGQSIAQHYTSMRAADNSNVFHPWPEGTQPGEWRSDPLNAPQEAWGPAWGTVTPFALESSTQFTPPGPPALTSEEYAAAYNEVKNYGALSTYGPDNTPTSRTAEQTQIGLFWAYDRASMGPPPVLFLEGIRDIALAAGTSPEDNARLFALASISMADAAITAWDAKFTANLWRPISGIREGDTDGNDLTIADPNWVPLGAPGSDHNSSDDDFTPPFPAYTSGHATMGGAVFKAIELFFGTNDFATADAMFGDDPIDEYFTLFSAEEGGGGSRTFNSFTQQGPLGIGLENSPEGENATSRVYLGVHWMFDQVDGTYMGNDIASYVFANYFQAQAVPEPATWVLMLLGATGASAVYRRRQAGRRGTPVA